MGVADLSVIKGYFAAGGGSALMTVLLLLPLNISFCRNQAQFALLWLHFDLTALVGWKVVVWVVFWYCNVQAVLTIFLIVFMFL